MLTSLVANHSPINSYQSNKKSPDDDTDPDLIPNQYGNYLLYDGGLLWSTINNMFNYNYFHSEMRDHIGYRKQQKNTFLPM